jgi:hypothetical protein
MTPFQEDAAYFARSIVTEVYKLVDAEYAACTADSFDNGEL